MNYLQNLRHLDYAQNLMKLAHLPRSKVHQAFSKVLPQIAEKRFVKRNFQGNSHQTQLKGRALAWVGIQVGRNCNYARKFCAAVVNLLVCMYVCLYIDFVASSYVQSLALLYSSSGSY